MALGGKYSPSNFIQTAQQADQAGLSAAKSLAGLMQSGFQMGGQMQDAARRDQARKAFGDAWASGDQNAIVEVMQRFPEFAKQAQEMIGIRDDQHRKDVGSMAIQLSGLLDSGDLQGASDFIKQRAGMFDKEGKFSAGNLANAISTAGNDPQKLAAFKDWAQKLTLSTLKPNEITGWQNAQQQMAQQLQLGEEQIGLQRELGGQRNQLGWAQLAAMNKFRGQQLGMQRERLDYLKTKGAPGGAGGLQPVQLSNGETLNIDPKVHGSGANAFYQGRDANGNIVNVPVSSIVSPISAGEQAGAEGLGTDIDSLINAGGDNLEHITGYLRGGGTGKMPIGADTYTGYAGGTAREIFNAPNRIQGNLQNKGIAAAKSMGATGINTLAEAKMYFQSMPQLDYSSPESLISSAKTIKNYTDKFNREHGVKYSGKNSGGSVQDLSDEDLLEGL